MSQILITETESELEHVQQNLTASEELSRLMPAWGCPKLIPLDEIFQKPEQVDYLDLLPRSDKKGGEGVHAVAAHQGTSLLYLVHAEHSQRLAEADIQALRHTLANRSESAWLGIVRSGTLVLYPISFEEQLPSPKEVSQADDEAPLFFQSLVQGTFSAEVKPQASDHVYQEIKRLLTRTTEAFVDNDLLDPLHVLSMSGRALFFRFLIDRKIVRPSERAKICPSAKDLKDAFSNPVCAAQTSAWLDETFNGDFLPIIDDSLAGEKRLAAYKRFYKEVSLATHGDLFEHLEAILKGWKAVDGQQLTFDWNDLDFAHIPVGVLSEVYEHFSHRVDRQLSLDKSVHYTPRFIASFMVDEAFTAMSGDKSQARLLDPASGAGIFLVLGFRRLFREHFEVTGNRPDKDIIQEILYKQIRGFDVSEPALRLAALALYITAIELNATPRPPKSLMFPRNLRGTVLHHFGEEAAADAYPHDRDQAALQSLLGSLGELPRREGLESFDGAFDLVIGNPPWTRLRDEAPAARKEKTGSAGRVKKSASDSANTAFSKIARDELEARELKHLAKDYRNPDKAPDVPFLWRAAQWARPGGTIAYALHARLFLHTQGKKDIAWQAIQEALAITGIINGADLRWTKVWDGMKSPFCLFFARNEKSMPNEGFFFASPLAEYAINATSRFRIDYAAVRTITQQETKQRPWLLKTLSLGTTLDVEVMDRITKASPHTLKEYWLQFDPSGDRTGKGYDKSFGLPQKPAPFLGKLLDFEDPTNNGFSIEWDRFETYATRYNRSSGSFPRSESLYQPPLVIVPQAPGDDPYSPKAWLADRAVAFSQSYYGYACQDSPAPQYVAALIHVLAHSTLARYFIIMRSASLGSDFMRFLKDDFDALPFPDPAKLSAADKKALLRFSACLQAGEGQMPLLPPKAKKSQGAKKQAAQEGGPDLFHQALAPPAPAPNQQRERPLDFWHELNGFIFRLYGLGAEDVQVIQDTLFASAPYRRAGEAAFLPTSPLPEETAPSTRQVFCTELQQRLQPFFEVTGETVDVGEPSGLRQQSWNTTWRFIAVTKCDAKIDVPAEILQQAMADANQNGLSRIIVRLHHGRGLLIGILDARRWWTRTRARLCAHTITLEHLDAFDEPAPYIPDRPRRRILDLSNP
ncbi:N-6 DNA methylase [Prosthecobacter fusiformis]|uniref:N-6 DNA methylase n=1 Tax=Prosthecobacter fusiformis TaxID=48464 RepID=A0A4R7RJ06_9BACT|nr:DNA methyltransferase [Prosthecobacter fusiformis]TDU64088.1 N-6 DNA methylase [Prosthecobacter fusiformis]